MYFDTGGYIELVLNMNLGFGRSFFSGVFLWVASSSGWLFFVPAVIQALLAIWLITESLNRNQTHGLRPFMPWTIIQFISMSAALQALDNIEKGRQTAEDFQAVEIHDHRPGWSANPERREIDAAFGTHP